MGLRHWAAPQAPAAAAAAAAASHRGGEREGPPRRAAAEPSAAREAAPAPVFVYKRGSACRRNTVPLPGTRQPLPAR